jgi:hypothetical protein
MTVDSVNRKVHNTGLDAHVHDMRTHVCLCVLVCVVCVFVFGVRR